MWQNNLLKFYMEHDINKAITYSGELVDEVGGLLSPESLSDLHFSQGTSIALRGHVDDIDLAKDTLLTSLETAPVTS